MRDSRKGLRNDAIKIVVGKKVAQKGADANCTLSLRAS